MPGAMEKLKAWLAGSPAFRSAELSVGANGSFLVWLSDFNEHGITDGYPIEVHGITLEAAITKALEKATDIAHRAKVLEGGDA